VDLDNDDEGGDDNSQEWREHIFYLVTESMTALSEILLDAAVSRVCTVWGFLGCEDQYFVFCVVLTLDAGRLVLMFLWNAGTYPSNNVESHSIRIILFLHALKLFPVVWTAKAPALSQA